MRMGVTTGFLGGPYKREEEGQRQREMGDAVLLALRMEGEAGSQGCSASRSWKRQEPPEGTNCQSILDF